MSDPLVTTVLTTFRNPGLLTRAIDSVLGQTFRDLRLSIYDDASNDETEGVVGAYAARDARVTYHRHPSNIGLVHNFAFGLEGVTTPFFSFLSEDDWLLPDFYSIGMEGLESQPHAAFVSTRVIHVDDELSVVQQADITAGHAGLHMPPQGLLTMLERGAPTWTGTLFRTSAAKSLGGLNPETGDLIDVDLVLRLAANHAFMVDPRPGAIFSRRLDSASGQLRLRSTWPGWPNMIANLQRESLPPEIWKKVEGILTAQLIKRLYGTGLSSSRRGNSADAVEAATILEATFGRRREARMVRLAELMFRRIPPLGAVVPRVGRRRLPYVREGWPGRPVKLERYLAGDFKAQDRTAIAR